MAANDGTFFDIHMHALNLSHPYFYAFIKRYKLDMRWFLGIGIISLLAYIAGKIPFLGNAVRGFITRKQNTFNNLLSVLENDIGSFFLITEDCLRENENPLLNSGGLTIGTRKYKSMVLTPLMMDFGYKGKKKDSDFHYSRPAEKPIVEQVTDVFNAIKKYKQSVATRPDDDLCRKFPSLEPGTTRVIEIYPFLGINTQNYKLDKIKTMLDQYFTGYTGSRGALLKNMGQFDGNIGNIKSNYFAGVKVYPPLGFDPWPADVDEKKKVEYLYCYCAKHGIPITSHGGDGGFIAIDDKNDLRDFTSMSRWKSVLEHYPSLKLNIAHLPAEFWPRRVFASVQYRLEKQRLMAIVELVIEKENVYTDFSCRALNDNYYLCLKEVIGSRSSEDDKVKLRSRIMFGSDYAVSLGSIESYNRYLEIFSRTRHLTDGEKHLFCSVNPERFLFSTGQP